MPKRKSKNGTFWKKRSDSKISESTMPSVVRIATTEQAMSSAMTKRSTNWRERCRAEIVRQAQTKPTRATTARTTPSRRSDAVRQRSGKDRLPPASPASTRRRRCRLARARASRMKVPLRNRGDGLERRQKRGDDRSSIRGATIPQMIQMRDAGTAAMIAAIAAVIGGTRMQAEMRSPAIAKARSCRAR